MAHHARTIRKRPHKRSFQTHLESQSHQTARSMLRMRVRVIAFEKSHRMEMSRRTQAVWKDSPTVVVSWLRSTRLLDLRSISTAIFLLRTLGTIAYGRSRRKVR